MLNSDALIERGAVATQAREYIEQLITQIRELLLDRLINLAPDQTLLFTIYKAQLQCLDDIPAAVTADINAGIQAIGQMQRGDTQPQNGIL